MNTLRFLLTIRLKRSQLAQKNGGFTLIEVLVAMILAALVIGPLLGFMVNILDSDRKEQAKAASEQEIKAALDYIAQDLSQAVYVYDEAGLNQISTAVPPGIADQIPPTKAVGACDALAKCKPVLVFWKRQFLEKKQEVDTATGKKKVEDLTQGNDTFVYSLVGYYLIDDDSVGGLGSWSKTARIGRFEIQDGIRKSDNTYSKVPDKGFQLFDLSPAGDLSTKMNQWKKHPDAYETAKITNHPMNAVLIDYVDDYVDTTPTGPPCPSGLKPTSKRSGFYACVDASKGFAQVIIRGNALARIQSTPLPTWSAGSVYFPSASIQVQGRGFLYTK